MGNTDWPTKAKLFLDTSSVIYGAAFKRSSGLGKLAKVSATPIVVWFKSDTSEAVCLLPKESKAPEESNLRFAFSWLSTYSAESKKALSKVFPFQGLLALSGLELRDITPAPFTNPKVALVILVGPVPLGCSIVVALASTGLVYTNNKSTRTEGT